MVLALLKPSDIKNSLEKLPGVEVVHDVKMQDRLIQSFSLIFKSIGNITVRSLEVMDAKTLYDFFMLGLSEQSRNRFYPFPLFNPAPVSEKDLAKRIADWQKEDDWIFFNLFKERQIIGVVFLKKLKTAKPTSGLAVSDSFQNMGLGYLLQNIVVSQARLLNVLKIFIKVLPENIASKKIHEKSGFVASGMVQYFKYENGIKIDMDFLEMEIDLSGKELVS